MNVMKSLMGCFVLCLGLATGIEAQTVTLQAEADASLKQSPANKNRGGDPTLELAGDGRVLVRFDQTAIAAAVGSGRLVSASLELFVHATSGSLGPRRPAHRGPPRDRWLDRGGSHLDLRGRYQSANNKPDCASPWNGGSFADDATDSVVQTSAENVWMPFDVTADVAAFLGGTSNRGWLVVKADGDQSGKADYGSREGPPRSAPGWFYWWRAPRTIRCRRCSPSPRPASRSWSTIPRLQSWWSTRTAARASISPRSRCWWTARTSRQAAPRGRSRRAVARRFWRRAITPCRLRCGIMPAMRRRRAPPSNSFWGRGRMW